MTTSEPGMPGTAVEQDRLSVTHTGNADAQDGGLAVTGIQTGDDLTTMQASFTGDAHAKGPGAIAVSGVLNQHHHPLPPTPYQVHTSLPADTAAFTGRREETEAIIALVERAVGVGGVVTIQGGVQAIDGMPGIGKTALAVHVAHQVKARFADRQLFIDLHGHTPGADPVEAFEALGGLLTATGMDARYLPATLEERVSHWRDRMADQRALLVLDNARSSAQVTPLLPGTPGCLVLVTSRRYLGDLDTSAQPITLDVLPPLEARKLFRRLAPRASTDSNPAVDEVAVELAGGLPLAITLLARVYVRHPAWTLRALVGKTRDRLLTVHAEDATIAAAFDLSYATLPTSQQRLFTLLGVHPGPEIDDFAAAALADIPRSEAEEILEDLFGTRLLTEPSPEHPGRYGMHDLIRTYSRRHATTTLIGPKRDQALGRLLDYYQHTATRADALLSRHIRPAPAPVGTDADGATPASSPTAPALLNDAQALDWARTERTNLIACLDHATATSQHERIISLAAGLAGLLRRDGPWADAATRHITALEVARRLGNRLGEANALNDLGDLEYLTDEYGRATDLYGQALDLYRQLGNRLGEANALNNLGDLQYLTGEHGRATDLYGQALDLYRQLGNRLGEADALNNLGTVRYLTGEYRQALDLHGQALDLYRQLGNRLGEAHALNEIGTVRYLTGEYRQALDLHGQALDLYRQLGNRLGEANALNNLGTVRYLTGEYRQALDLHGQALDLYRQLGDRHGEANALAGAARCYLAVGRPERGHAGLAEALDLFQRIDAAEATKVAAELAALDEPDAGRPDDAVAEKD